MSPKNERTLFTIEGKWAVCSDSYNLILYRLGRTKKGTTSYTLEGYYSRFEDLINALIDRRVRSAEAGTMTKMLAEIKAIRTEVSTVLGEIKKCKLNDV